MPDACERFAAEPAELLCIVITFPAVPTATNAVTVVVVPAVKMTVFGAPMVNVPKVLLPVSVTEPEPPPMMLKLAYVWPAPANVLVDALVSAISIVDVPALRVSDAVVPIFHTVPVPVILHVPEPMFIVRVPVVLDRLAAVTPLAPMVVVPAVIVSAPLPDMPNSVRVPPLLLSVVAPVTVYDEPERVPLVTDRPALKVTFPPRLTVAPCTTNDEAVIVLAALIVPAVHVEVPTENASARANVPPEPLKTTFPSVFVSQVIVTLVVAAKVMVPLNVRVTPETRVKLPFTTIAVEPSQPPEPNPVRSKLLQVRLVVVTFPVPAET